MAPFLPLPFAWLWHSIYAQYTKAVRVLVHLLYKEPTVHKCPKHLTYHRIPGQWRRELLPTLPERAFEIPDRDAIPYGEIYYFTKGDYIGTGATSFVDRLSSGSVVKYPKPNPYCLHEENKCRQEIMREAEVYKRIGNNPRIPTLVQWDEASYTLVLEYLEHGSLDTYVENHMESITPTQRDDWAIQAAEAVAVVHAADVIHCDVTPRNFMLDQALQLRIADFAASSVAGSRPTRAASPRFQPPGWSWADRPKTRDDIFALGSVLYFIQTGHEPLYDVSEEEAKTLFAHAGFPDLSGLRCGSIIRRCWTGEWDSAKCIVTALKSIPKATET